MNMILKKQLQIRESKRKGFTLVEVIVVLVILAILMAIAIPALTGYINKASERKAISEARTFQTAIMAMTREAYATCAGDPVYGTIETTSKVRIGPWTGSQTTSKTTDKTYIETANELTGVNFKASNFFNSPSDKKITFTARYGTGELISFNYLSDDGIEIKYTKAGGFVRVK